MSLNICNAVCFTQYALLSVFLTSACASKVYAQDEVDSSQANATDNLEDNVLLQETVVVTGLLKEQSLHSYSGSISRLTNIDSTLTPVELISSAPGVNIQQGSGTEHLSGIRSPVLNGSAGAGSVLFLENDVSYRAPAFANINSLIDLDPAFADSIEVLRGPGDIGLGTQALHGAVNVQLYSPGEANNTFSFSAGSFDDVSSRLTLSDNASSHMQLSHYHTNRYRDDSALDKTHLRLATRKGRTDFRLGLNHVEQETAGFLVGKDAYNDSSRVRDNDNPEAFRDAYSLLASMRTDLRGITLGGVSWSPETLLYVRDNEMDFRMHFLPGTPLERNAHRSAGGHFRMLGDMSERLVLGFGTDLDVSYGTLKEDQSAPSRFSFVQGEHYDYSATSLAGGVYGKAIYSVERHNIDAGARINAAYFDYNNRLDRQPEVFGRFRRPADRNDSFYAPSYRLAYSYDLSGIERTSGKQLVFINLARGIRMPQVAELYRIQSNQNVDDIEAETLDSIEVGFKHKDSFGSIQLAAFLMSKRHGFFRGSDGFTINNARTDHQGIELDINLQITDALSTRMNATFAAHRYANTLRSQEDNEILFLDGNRVDTAPATLASVDFRYRINPTLTATLSGRHIGRYYTNAANSESYPGHSLLNASLSYAPVSQLPLRVTASVKNIGDKLYADRADFAFGNERYFPGLPRHYRLTIDYTF